MTPQVELPTPEVWANALGIPMPPAAPCAGCGRRVMVWLLGRSSWLCKLCTPALLRGLPEGTFQFVGDVGRVFRVSAGGTPGDLVAEAAHVAAIPPPASCPACGAALVRPGPCWRCNGEGGWGD